MTKVEDPDIIEQISKYLQKECIYTLKLYNLQKYLV